LAGIITNDVPVEEVMFGLESPDQRDIVFDMTGATFRKKKQALLQNIQRMKVFIHQLDDWPQFTWRLDEIVNLLTEVRNLQGRVMGRMESLGFALRNEATLETITLDVLKSTEIEGEFLNPEPGSVQN
jgi:hypothetical protein